MIQRLDPTKLRILLEKFRILRISEDEVSCAFQGESPSSAVWSRTKSLKPLQPGRESAQNFDKAARLVAAFNSVLKIHINKRKLDREAVVNALSATEVDISMLLTSDESQPPSCLLGIEDALEMHFCILTSIQVAEPARIAKATQFLDSVFERASTLSPALLALSFQLSLTISEKLSDHPVESAMASNRLAMRLLNRAARICSMSLSDTVKLHHRKALLHHSYGEISLAKNEFAKAINASGENESLKAAAYADLARLHATTRRTRGRKAADANAFQNATGACELARGSLERTFTSHLALALVHLNSFQPDLAVSALETGAEGYADAGFTKMPVLWRYLYEIHMSMSMRQLNERGEAEKRLMLARRIGEQNSLSACVESARRLEAAIDSPDRMIKEYCKSP